MDPTVWLTLTITYAAVCVVPGPSVAVVLGQTLDGGRRAAAFCILGDMMAALVLIALSLFGLGAIMATSATLFAAVKWAGVAYMAALGLLMIREGWRSRGASDVPPPARSHSVRAGFVTGILNPKGTAFYVAFLAQFVDPGRDLLVQFIVIVGTVWTVMALILASYAFAAAAARHALSTSAARRGMQCLGGTVLLGGSVVLATQRTA